MNINQLAGLMPLDGVSPAQHELITSCMSSTMDHSVTDPAMIEALLGPFSPLDKAHYLIVANGIDEPAGQHQVIWGSDWWKHGVLVADD